ncbi:hypothetical protein THRCLA_06618 [Thraustotheca clavata]|uniref:Nucleotide-diphospho-sugar transferase n=1 Tax=Thraustotheca clavata TaxID=74557 RepID=A0A1V9ZLR9_9STRA|nr:hypothetical protein THRCLA_06618 [Thraustotheca clavata]
MAFPSLSLAVLKPSTSFTEVVSDKFRRALSNPIEDARLSALDKVSIFSNYYSPAPLCPQTPPPYQTLLPAFHASNSGRLLLQKLLLGAAATLLLVGLWVNVSMVEKLQPSTYPTLQNAPLPHLEVITKGIIVCMFDAMLPIGVSLIHELRKRGNRDVIQVYHCLGELSPLSQRILINTDPLLEIIDPCTEHLLSGTFSFEMAKDFRNFFLKPLAIHHTRLLDVLVIDADCILLEDPAKLWKVEAYETTGTVFFYDRVIRENSYLNGKHEHDGKEETTLQELLRIWPYDEFNMTFGPSQTVLQALSYNKHTAHEQDSSILAIDKRRASNAMAVLWKLITHQRYHLTYSWGDKENFWLAFELSHTPYSFSPFACAATGKAQEHDPRTVCGDIAHYFPSASDSVRLFHVNGNGLINPYRKVDYVNGYDTQFDPNKMNELMEKIPTYVSAQTIRAPTPIVQPNGSCPQECMYDHGAELVPEGFREHFEWRIRKTFQIAHDIDFARRTIED